MASFVWNGGSGGWGTIANWTGGVPNATSADATIAAGGSYIVTVESGDAYTIDSVGVNDGGALLDVAGTLSLSGAAALADIIAGTLELAGVLAGGTLQVENGATLLAAGGKLTGEKDFYQGGSGVIALNGSALSLGGTSTLQGYITGPGKLVISGLATLTDTPDFEDGSTLDDTGTIVLASGANFANNGGAVTGLVIGAGAIFDITAANSGWNDEGLFNVTNAGLFEMTAGNAYYSIGYNSFGNTGTIAVAANSDIDFGGATLALGGTVLGPGEVYLGNGGGTVSLESGLSFNTGTLVAVGGESIVLAAAVTLGTDFNANYNNNLDLNGFELTLTGAAGSERGYVYGGGTLDIAGTTDIGGLYLAAGTEELVTGTAIDDVANTRLDYDNGTGPSILSIATTGTYDITEVNAQIDYNGNLGTIINAGLFEAGQTQPTNGFNVFENFTNASTGTIAALANDDVSLLYGQDSLAGTIEGPGDLYIGQHATASLAGSLVINIAVLTISDGGTDVILGGNTTFGNEFTEQNNADLSLNGDTLTVNGSGALDGYISGPGTVDIAGTYITGEYFSSGVTEVLTGTMYQQYNTELDDDNGVTPSVLSIAAGGLYDMEVGNGSIYNGSNNGSGTGTIVNAGLFENTQYGGYENIYTNFINASTGTISVLPFDDISLLTGQNQLGGTVTGLGGFGELYLGQGSHTTLEAGLALSIGEIVLSDGNTNLDLTANQSFGGTFVLQNSAVVYAQGHTFSLGGPAYLDNAYIAGPGAVAVTGFGDVSGLVLTEKGELIVSGDLNQTGGFQFGNGGGDTGQMSITTTGTFALLNNNYISTNGSGVIANAGLFEKTGDNGYSQIDPRFNNAATGTVDVADGVLSFEDGGSLGGTITGAGQFQLSGGTFTLAAKAVVNVGIFQVNGGVLTEIGNHTITSLFEELNNDLSLGGFNLTIGNGYLENAYDSGPGALIVTGSDVLQNFVVNNYGTLVDAGTIIQQQNLELGNFSSDNNALSITTAGIYDLVDNGQLYAGGGLDTVVNAGLLEKTGDDTQSNINVSFTNTSKGTIDAAIGVIAFTGAASNVYDRLGGTIMGASEVDLDNNYILLSSQHISVAVLAVNASASLGNNISFAGTFDLNPNNDLNLNGYTLTLTGTDYLQGGLGGGTATESGTGLANLLDIQGGSDLIDTGLIEQVNTLRFGYYFDGTQNTLAIAAGGTYEFLDDSGMADYINGTASANIYLSGLLEKTGGAGISEIQPTLTNTGTLLAATGTIQLDNPADLVAGTLTEGVWEVTGGALVFKSGAPITVDAADIVISGKSSNIYSGPTAGTSLFASLTSIAAGGTLALIGASALASPVQDSGTLVLSGGNVTGLSVLSGGVSDVLSGGVASATTVFNGGAQDVFAGGKAKFAVVSSGGMEFVSSGGLATSTTVESLGSSTVYSGGVASNVTIAGGVFDLISGGTASGFIDFTGTGGEFIIAGKTMPTTTISGFVAGDTIQLAGVVYSAGARVTVATAGTVSVIDGGKTYNLDIAGATVGETDFAFGSGSLLTKTGTQKPKMAFVTPASAGTASTTAAALAQTPSPVATSAAPAVVSSAAAPSAATDLLTMVNGGGAQVMPVTLTVS